MQKQKQNQTTEDPNLPLKTKNYRLILIGVIIIIVGFALMAGGEPSSAEGFNYNIFSWRRITLAPIVVVVGFVFEIYAIMKK